MAAIGLPPDLVYQIVQRRKTSPFTPADMPALIQGAGPAGARLRLGGGSFFTVRATARLRLANGTLSDLKRTVAALIKLMPAGYDSPVHVLRWYDTAWSN